MSNEVRVGSLADVNDIVYGEEYQDSLGLVVIITGVDSIASAAGMLSQLMDMVESNQWCILDKVWMKRVVEIGSLLSDMSLCLEQLGENIEQGVNVPAKVHRLRDFQDPIQYLREGPLPPEIRDMLRRLWTLLGRRFSTSEPVFEATHLQQQSQDLVTQILGTTLLCPAFQDGPKVEYIIFEDETKQLLDLLAIETPPLSDSQKAIFLDELLNNCSRSLDMVKLRKDNAVSPPLFIEIIINKEKNTLTVRDTGMGMTRSDLIDKLSKVARPGTKDFIKSADDSVNMTDQIAIGFFSAYFVANKVVVTTKHDNNEQYIWEPRSNASYTVSPNNGGKSLGRGTKITLYLKPDQGAYLDLHHVTAHVKKCSALFDHEVYLVVENSVSVPEVEDLELASVPESHDLELVSGITPGCNHYRFRLIKDKPLPHKRSNEVGEPDQRKKRKVQ